MNAFQFPMQIITLALLFNYLVFGLIGLTCILSLWNILGVTRRRGEDISHLELKPIPELNPIVSILEKLGFERLGELEVILPIHQVGREWIFVSPDRLTHAEIVSTNTRMIVFTSIYRDHATLETGYPMGEHITTPDFQSHTITTGIEQAYNYHRAQLSVFGIPHGTPIRMESMEDFMNLGTIYRQRHAPMKFRRFLWIELGNAACILYSLAAGAFTAARILEGEIATALLQKELTALLLNLLPASILVIFILPLIATLGSKRQPKRND